MTSVPMMTCLPWARARRTSGVSAGRAATSNTVSALSTTSGATGRSSAAGPPDIPTGGRVDQQLWPARANLGPPGIAVLVGQGVARDHRPCVEARVTERRDHGLGHAL